MIVECRNQKERDQLSFLWDGWNETLLWSCLDGSMGHLYADSLSEPTCSMALLGDFCFFAGDASSKAAQELVNYKPAGLDQWFVIMVGQTPAWNELIAHRKQGAPGTAGTPPEAPQPVTRYAIKKEGDIFDRTHLRNLIAKLPAGFSIHPLDESIFTAARQEEWQRDWCSQFATWADFSRQGIGFVIRHDETGEIVSGCSSYSVFTSHGGGVEIEIDTKDAWRGRGLAKSIGAHMVLACLERGLYPSWDAANLTSVHMAELFGYHFDHEYQAFWIRGW